MIKLAILLTFIVGGLWSNPGSAPDCKDQRATAGESVLCLKHDEDTGTISVFRAGDSEPLLVQNAPADIRPYIHPIVAPDGKGILTEYRPSHHIHQTGIYWGLKMVNGRDYFMECCRDPHSNSEYVRRVGAEVVKSDGQQVTWRTVYDLLDENGNTTLTETQTWSMQEVDGKYILDLLWEGHAEMDVTVGKFYVGGLFIRMPWHKGISGQAVNASGQRNGDAETQRAIWTDVGMEIEGRSDDAHIAVFDHPQNNGFPTAWRVDSQLGIGPSRQIREDWALKEGETEVFRYRLLVYTGDLEASELTREWTEFAGGE